MIVWVNRTAIFARMLGDQDSNLNKQNQNLLCYRYTIPQDSDKTIHSTAPSPVRSINTHPFLAVAGA